MKVVVYNLGCKVNQYECDALSAALRARGYDVSEELEEADVYLLNTCAVTNEAERKSRQCVTRCMRYNPRARVVVCGCASENDAEQFFGKDGVTYVSGTADKAALIGRLEESGICVAPLPSVYEDDFVTERQRTRAYVKVQDGCNNFCTYCLIPYLRGRSRSRSEESVIAECCKLSAESKEIVLTGIDLSAYGTERGGSLSDLLSALNGIDCRIRLGSLEVNVIDRRFLDACAGLRAFCPQFHLSLQSGQDDVLQSMNRHYTTRQYEEKVDLIREYYPNAGITTDLICGFPTETEERFGQTLAFVRRMGFSQMHVFGYSPRKGTVASKRYRVLDGAIVKDRCERAAIVAAQSKEEWLLAQIGRSTEVLIEERIEGCWEGYSREYARVRLCGDAQSGELIDAKVYGVQDGCLLARIV